MKLLVASNNPKKLVELQRILDAHDVAGVELLRLADVPAYPEPEETGRTFADNALIKARAGVAHTGLATVADDSGLTVEELGGMPGVLSARWSGTHGDDAANNALLLSQLASVPDSRRQAAFVSVCALVTPDGEETLATGQWAGRILREPAGEGGFGYDPLFVPNEEDGHSGTRRTAAQLTPEEKDSLSHRGKALSQLAVRIKELAQRDGA
ncbi:RdgB/HAM1 family non-canonical purine NTP pyrophosphatase [Corynebacterium uberis]|uniref:RdgB/HAM1 family non-canonical purine NTP pyrophosphatase n=1 Tax=Corynebacterium TaxID=1716 RepID=UPI001D0B9FE0|nr:MULTISPECIES: RdgB/HAM1 family non-canonical purine NTP pyrophosphatase [Corynebacterium]MCZ9310222.1 RdgB/HAM1 family non-canonical purine NTP pyrophosphatase [Corynebacterium sp. c6VSa_13]UDL73698.1 RdgB/HAM1 family non-canonical purine NTP pyrophosphatase [Corynebacterium uberis]UDL75420.1 RdgB/HAM1 family non-canonical purine NTP pyrophosphatase [Corynebacterium uberis]UDL77633.1 RdgB/HAM1 family non-canonical purine NTP pyrophosphatase [Corynebacterium uberis]UDL79918.1 RdgB/HAM1 famil